MLNSDLLTCKQNVSCSQIRTLLNKSNKEDWNRVIDGIVVEERWWWDGGCGGCGGNGEEVV